MPHFYLKSYDPNTGVVVLNNGVTYNTNDLPGNGWNANRLANLRERILEFVEDRISQADMPVDDPERTWTAQDFTDNYPAGNRYLDESGGPGSPWVVERNIDISIEWDGARLLFSMWDVT
jgi:hypothetical protein